MINNIYDKDISTISPDGEIFQLKYAITASNRGNMILGMTTLFHTFLVSCCDNVKNTKDHNDKILSVAENFGVLVSGVIGDAKYIHKYLEKNKTEYEEAFSRPYPLSSAFFDIHKIYSQTIFNSKTRPFGVNLIIGGYDATGPTLFSILPDCKIEKKNRIFFGSIKKIEMLSLKKNVEGFHGKMTKFSVDEMTDFLLRNLKKSFTNENYLIFIKNNLRISLVGKKTPWLIIEDAFFKRFVDFGKKCIRRPFPEKNLINTFKKSLGLIFYPQKNQGREKDLKMTFFLKLQICFNEKNKAGTIE